MKIDIAIPFLPEWGPAMIEGRKTCTTRTRKYGEPGDHFSAFGCLFQLTQVERMWLDNVLRLWRQEGVASPEDFVKIWKRLHPRRGFDENWKVWVHHFEKINDEA